MTRERYDALVTEEIEFVYYCNHCSLTRGFSELPFHNDDESTHDGENESIQRGMNKGEEVGDGERRVEGGGRVGDDSEASQPAPPVCDSTSTATRSISTSDMANFHRKGMAFIHLNVRSLLPKISELSVILHRTKASILAVSETHLDSGISDSEVNIQGYTLVCRDKNRNGGGVCLFLKDTVSFNVGQDLE